MVTVNGGTLDVGYVLVGNGAGGNGNSFFVTNGTVVTTILNLPAQNQGLILGGAGTSNNTVRVVGNSTWTAPGQGISLQVGPAGASYGNAMTVDNSVVTNFSYLTMNGLNNSLTLTNNAKLFITADPYSASTYLGLAAVDSNLTISVLAGSYYSDLNGKGFSISVGGGYSNQLIVNGGTFTNNNGITISGVSSGLIVTNGTVTIPSLAVGSNGTNDFVTVSAGGKVDLMNGLLTLGSGVVSGNR